MSSTRRFAFTAAHRMIHRIHGNPASLWSLTLPTVTACLTYCDQLVFLIADFTYSRSTINLNSPHLTAWQPESGVVPFFGNHLNA
jgi:hypothetical protein